MVLMSLNEAFHKPLLKLARDSIQQGLDNGCPLKTQNLDLPIELTENRATFVTLEKQGKLRGCIGMLEAIRPLAEDVAENAYSAAFKDPRFPALQFNELQHLDIHLSILSPSQVINFSSEKNLLMQIRPGIDGLILEDKGRRGTFLPSVWEALNDSKQFLHQLKLKAGLPIDHWSDTIKVSRYTTELIK